MTTGLALFFVIPNLFRDLVFISKGLGFESPLCARGSLFLIGERGLISSQRFLVVGSAEGDLSVNL